MRRAVLKPIPWRRRSETIYDARARDELYKYIDTFVEAADIFVNPEDVHEGLLPVPSDTNSPCEGYPSSVHNLLFVFTCCSTLIHKPQAEEVSDSEADDAVGKGKRKSTAKPAATEQKKKTAIGKVAPGKSVKRKKGSTVSYSARFRFLVLH